MKIAIVTDDHQTISAHFGRATYYQIFTIENNKVTERQVVSRSNHHTAEKGTTAQGDHHHHDHSAMMAPILDCDVLITRGIGTGAYNALKLLSIQPIITDLKEIEAAVNAYLAGSIIDHPERVH